MFILKNLLTGQGEEASAHLEDLWKRVPAENPALCWYPSAGDSFCDLLLWARYPLQTIRAPDIFIRTDYDYDFFQSGQLKPGACYQDQGVRAEITRISELRVAPDVQYTVHPDFAIFVDHARPKPCAHLMDVQVKSGTGSILQPVLYFHFENFNWFEEFVLKRKMQISHLFKLAEGCSFGGNNKSVSSLYGFLGLMGCQAILTDQMVHFDWRLFHKYRDRYARHADAAFHLADLGEREMRTGYTMKSFSVERQPGPVSDEVMERALDAITEGSCWRDWETREEANEATNGGNKMAEDLRIRLHMAFEAGLKAEFGELAGEALRNVIVYFPVEGLGESALRTKRDADAQTIEGAIAAPAVDGGTMWLILSNTIASAILADIAGVRRWASVGLDWCGRADGGGWPATEPEWRWILEDPETYSELVQETKRLLGHLR